jgi:glycosyltransferase involved in cell wall biosynthesis
MRVLTLVHQYLPEHVGGVELYTQWLTYALKQRGHQAVIFYRRSAEGVGWERRLEEGVDVWAAWAGMLSPTRRFLATFGDPPLVKALEHVLGQTEPDIIHVQHLMGLPVALFDSIRRRRIPLVITLWDYWWVCANAQLLTNYSQQVCDGPWAYFNCARCALARSGHFWFWPALPALAGLLAWRNRLLHRIMRGANRLIAPTEFVRRWYASHGVLSDHLLVVPPGLDYPAFEAPQKPTASQSVHFAYIGGISWQKGIHVLLEAFKEVRGSVELWIAGDESFDPAYASWLHALAPSNVRFLGKLTRQEVWETLAQVDVVVVPSIWYETFSFLISEGFAAGMPVVASRLGPLADRVRDGIDGLLVPPGDVAAWQGALQRLADEPELLSRLRANVLRPMTQEEHVSRLESLYAELVERAAPCDN